MLARAPWNPDYKQVLASRLKDRERFRRDPSWLEGALAQCARNPVSFISRWCNTYDPRNAGADESLVTMPFVLFQRQREMVEFLRSCLEEEASGLIEKSRDMGATWVAVCFSVWLWRFWPGASVGWGSRKAALVDSRGDMDSIFEKMRACIRGLPPEFLPRGFSEECMTHMKVINPDNGASITGESGDDIGRGGRKLIYFKDESAHYEHPESIEAALADNTRVQIDISSVNGLGNVFHRRREAGADWVPNTRARADKTNVFVMDWRDHPHKTQAWYDQREAKARDDGLLHVFYQEVDRNYAASVDGIIIPAAWVKSAIDAHVVLPWFEEDGGWSAALDVADGGGDRNALAARKGVVLRELKEWGERDTGLTARRAVDNVLGRGDIEVQYDCIGVGSGIKAEINRLDDEHLLPEGIRFIPWDAGSGPKDPDEHVEAGDEDTPLNKDYYQNLKAQGWWQLRRRFERTHRAVTEGIRFPVDELISLPSNLPKLRELQKELSQPVQGKSTRMKLLVDKMPQGTRSPNLADAVVMCYFPVTSGGYDSTMAWVD
jgi:phage terminase large subunit